MMLVAQTTDGAHPRRGVAGRGRAEGAGRAWHLAQAHEHPARGKASWGLCLVPPLAHKP